MTDNRQELDVILDRFGNGVIEAYLIAPKSRATADLSLESGLNEAQQAISDWHNKQIEEVLDRLAKETERCQDGCWVAIKAERNKLKAEL